MINDNATGLRNAVDHYVSNYTESGYEQKVNDNVQDQKERRKRWQQQK